MYGFKVFKQVRLRIAVLGSRCLWKVLDYRDELEGLTDAINTTIAMATLIIISTISTIGFFEEIV